MCYFYKSVFSVCVLLSVYSWSYSHCVDALGKGRINGLSMYVVGLVSFYVTSYYFPSISDYRLNLKMYIIQEIQNITTHLLSFNSNYYGEYYVLVRNAIHDIDLMRIFSYI
jgi:hypothetical protein